MWHEARVAFATEGCEQQTQQRVAGAVLLKRCGFGQR